MRTNDLPGIAEWHSASTAAATPAPSTIRRSQGYQVSPQSPKLHAVFDPVDPHERNPGRHALRVVFHESNQPILAIGTAPGYPHPDRFAPAGVWSGRTATGRTGRRTTAGLPQLPRRHPADLQPPLYRLSWLSRIALQPQARFLPRGRSGRFRLQSVFGPFLVLSTGGYGYRPDDRGLAKAWFLSSPGAWRHWPGPARRFPVASDGQGRLRAQSAWVLTRGPDATLSQALRPPMPVQPGGGRAVSGGQSRRRHALRPARHQPRRLRATDRLGGE